MTTTSTDTVTDYEEDVFQRDGYGRPLIADPLTGEVMAYTRISTFANTLTEKHLATYHQWWAMKAYSMFPEEGAVIAGARDQKGQQKAINNLLDRAGMNLARDRGTARHARVRQYLTGATMPDLTTEQTEELEHVASAVRALGQLVSVEQPLVNDEWRLAGSADYVGYCHDGRPYIADLKTGKSKYGNGTEWALQLIAYARSQRWDGSQRLGYVCQEMPRLFIIHAPQDRAEVNLYEYDPETCKTLAFVAVDVLHARSIKPELDIKGQL